MSKELMKPAYKIALIILLPTLTIGLSLLALSQTAADISLADWLEDDQGYQQALSEQSHSAKPIILFFHTEWCNNCKALKENVLITAAAKSMLDDFIKVKINPEISLQTQTIARRYGVVGFPTIVVIPAQGSRAQRYIPRHGLDPQQFTVVIRNLASVT